MNPQHPTRRRFLGVSAATLTAAAIPGGVTGDFLIGMYPFVRLPIDVLARMPRWQIRDPRRGRSVAKFALSLYCHYACCRGWSRWRQEFTPPRVLWSGRGPENLAGFILQGQGRGSWEEVAQHFGLPKDLPDKGWSNASWEK